MNTPQNLIKTLILALTMGLPQGAAAQDGILNPEEGGFAALQANVSARPDWLGVTCWQIYEVQKGGMHSAAMQAMQACAAAGNEPSMILLSHAYDNGLGVPRDAGLAAHWVKQAALRGYSTAQYHYGLALLQGRGVARDEGQARFWLMQAAAQGDRDAKGLLQGWPMS